MGSFSLLAADVGCKKNCIYYTHWLGALHAEADLYEPWKVLEIFDLETGSMIYEQAVPDSAMKEEIWSTLGRAKARLYSSILQKLVALRGWLLKTLRRTFRVLPDSNIKRAKRKKMKLVLPWLTTIWKAWDLRMFMLTSLFLQVILVLSGNLRKRITKKWLSLILWLAYLLADSVAISSLGYLANSEEDANSKPPSTSPGLQNTNNNYNLLAFWAPFLLLHLGGPDTITAFSLEDNELWLRHLLNLVFQVAFAIYVYTGSLPKTRLLFPAVLMFLAGIIKYGERTWALMSSSMDRLRNSMITKPDPGPDYAKFMEEYTSKKAAGLPIEIIVEEESEAERRSLDTEVEELKEEMVLTKAYEFVQSFKRLIVDLILSFRERNESRAFFLKRSPNQAFKMIEIELAFLYEMLCTKSPVIHRVAGCVFRLITFFAILSSLIVFIFTKKDVYRGTDIVITYILLGGALVLQCYSVGLLVFSDWAYLILKDTKLSHLSGIIYATISFFRPSDKPRWSNSVAQYNLVSFCLRDLNRSRFKGLVEHIGLKDVWDNLWHTGGDPVTPKLKEFLFKEIKTKSIAAENSRIYKRFGAYRGEWSLQRKGYLNEFGWSVEVEFDESILLWHIATELCYRTSINDSEKNISTCKISKQISDYMLYLLLMQPFMLTAGIGQIRYGDTCAEAKYHFQSGSGKLDETAACEMLLSMDTEVPPAQVKGDRSQSVLFDGCILAKELNKLGKRKWDMISTVWVEMLCYAAGHCRGLYHAKQLNVGGELLTLVWLLMAHLGIGEQFRIEAGDARAKLIIGK